MIYYSQAMWEDMPRITFQLRCVLGIPFRSRRRQSTPNFIVYAISAAEVEKLPVDSEHNEPFLPAYWPGEPETGYSLIHKDAPDPFYETEGGGYWIENL